MEITDTSINDSEANGPKKSHGLALGSLLQHVSLFTATSLLNRAYGLILLPLYARLLVKSDFGMVDLLQTTAAFATVLVALEVSQGFARNFSDANDDKAKQEIASTAFWFSLASYGLFTVLLMLFSKWIAEKYLDDSQFQSLVIVFAITFLLGSMSQFMIDMLRWGLKTRAYSICSLTSGLATMLATVVLLVLMKNVMAVFLGRIIGLALGLLPTWYFNQDILKAKFSVHRLREMLVFSLPLVPSSLGVMVSLFVDRLMVKEMMTLDDVAVLGVGYRIASISYMTTVGFSMVMTPLIYAHQNEPETPEQIARIFRYYCISCLLFLVGLTIFATELTQLLAGSNFQSSASLIPCLVGATLVSSMYLFAPGNAIAKKTSIIAVIHVAGGLLNLVLNWFLIGPLGCQGSAIATLLSSICVFAAYIVSSQRLYCIPHRWSPLLSGVALATLTIILATYVFPSLAIDSLLLSLVLRSFLLMLFAAMVAPLIIGLPELKSNLVAIKRKFLPSVG